MGSLRVGLSLAQGVVDMAAVIEGREGATDVIDLAIQDMSGADRRSEKR